MVIGNDDDDDDDDNDNENECQHQKINTLTCNHTLFKT